MNPCSVRSSSCFFSSSSSAALIRYGALVVGVAPGLSSMRWSISRCGGRPLGKSSGNTSRNSCNSASNSRCSGDGGGSSARRCAGLFTSAISHCSPSSISTSTRSHSTTCRVSRSVLRPASPCGCGAGSAWRRRVRLPTCSVTVPVFQLMLGSWKFSHGIPRMAS